jgi:hypothetical protein
MSNAVLALSVAAWPARITDLKAEIQFLKMGYGLRRQVVR